MPSLVELRCPQFQYRLFGKLLGVSDATDVVMEYACKDCRKAMAVRKVVHRYDLAGRLVGTEVVR